VELAEARRVTEEGVFAGEAESVRLEEALGRVLAGGVSSPWSLPREPRSRFDGFAVRSLDTSAATADVPAALEIVPGLVAAGYRPRRKTVAGKSIRVLTGAPIPEGADAVVRWEEAEVRGSRLLLRRFEVPGSGIASSGEDVQAGGAVLSDGDILTPTRLALVGALGFERISVYRRPSVAILATGDEVRELGRPLEGPWTFCNNRHLIAWLTSLQGGEAMHLGVAPDNPGSIAERLENARTDLVITTGGMGGGDRDYVLEAWRMLGVEVRFSRINLSPGKNSAFGLRGRQMFWGLPGIPWAAQVVFEELVSPLLRKLQGLKTEKPRILASLKTRLKNSPGFHKAVRGTLNLDSILPSFVPVESKGISRFEELRGNFAYTLLDSSVVEVPAGSEVQVSFHDFPLLVTPVFEKAELH
jgi:molybdopterin molybdotransferase